MIWTDIYAIHCAINLGGGEGTGTSPNVWYRDIRFCKNEVSKRSKINEKVGPLD